MLTLRTADYHGDFTLFSRGPKALEEFLEIGYEIVNQCRRLMPAAEVAHDEAMAADAGVSPEMIEEALDRR